MQQRVAGEVFKLTLAERLRDMAASCDDGSDAIVDAAPCSFAPRILLLTKDSSLIPTGERLALSSRPMAPSATSLRSVGPLRSFPPIDSAAKLPSLCIRCLEPDAASSRPWPPILTTAPSLNISSRILKCLSKFLGSEKNVSTSSGVAVVLVTPMMRWIRSPGSLKMSVPSEAPEWLQPPSPSMVKNWRTVSRSASSMRIWARRERGDAVRNRGDT